MKQLPDFKKLIDLIDRKMDAGGFEVSYMIFGREENIIARPQEVAADMLHRIGVLDIYTGKGNGVHLGMTIVWEDTDNQGKPVKNSKYVSGNWKQFAEAVVLTEKMAMDIACYKEKQRHENNITVMAGRDYIQQEDVLTNDEVTCWQLLRKVKSKSIWGHSIRGVVNTPNSIAIRQLLNELKSAAKDDAGTMRKIVGDLAYEVLMKIKTQAA